MLQNNLTVEGALNHKSEGNHEISARRSCHRSSHQAKRLVRLTSKQRRKVSGVANKLLHDNLYLKDNLLYRETSGDQTGIGPRLRLISLAISEKGCWSLCDKKAPLHQTENAHLTHQDPMERITTSSPLELVSIDYLHWKLTREVLSIFWLLKTVLQGSPKRMPLETSPEKFFDDLILLFSYPWKPHHNQLREFENELLKILHQQGGVGHSKTTLQPSSRKPYREI